MKRHRLKSHTSSLKGKKKNMELLSPGGGNGNPLQYSCLKNPMDRLALQATVHRVTKSQTRPKGLSTGNVEHDLEIETNKECFDS